MTVAILTSRADDRRALFDEAFLKKLEYLHLVSRKTFTGRTRAERRSRKAGTGVEFADYRRYSAGDDYRQIDWNVYGRIDRLMLRLYEEEEDLSVYLLLDCSSSMGFGHPSKLDYGKRIVAALSYIALNHLDRVGIVALTDRIAHRLPPTRGKNRIFSVFDFLRPIAAEGPTQLGEALGTFAAQHKRRGVAILVSDLYDPEGFEAGVDKLRYARFETHVVHLVDPADATPAAHGDVELVDVESGRTRPVTVTPALRARYREAYAAYRARVEAYCVHKQVNWVALDVHTPADEAVLHLLRRGGMVA